MKLKEALKERVKERINEVTTSSGAYQSGSSNSTRYTPPGQERTLDIPQMAGYIQVENPVAQDPMPEGQVADGPDTQMDRGIGYSYNNKIRREPTGELTASGLPGEAYASPAEYVEDQTTETQGARATASTV